jgi:hypothetical protein
MFRTILGAATAACTMTLLASTASACISCEYVPEVLHARESNSRDRIDPHGRHSKAYVAAKQSQRAAQLKAAAAQAAAAKAAGARQAAAARAAAVRAAQVKAAKAESAAKIVQAEAKPAQTDTAEITTGSVDTSTAKADDAGTKVEAVAAEADAVKPAAKDTAVKSTTAMLISKSAKAEEPAKQTVGCKKFLPSVGITVDCK